TPGGSDARKTTRFRSPAAQRRGSAPALHGCAAIHWTGSRAWELESGRTGRFSWAEPPQAVSAPSVGRWSLHHRRASAIDVDRAAGHIGGGVGDQETGDVGELLGPAHAAERHRPPGLDDEVFGREVGALA